MVVIIVLGYTADGKEGVKGGLVSEAFRKYLEGILETAFPQIK